MADKKRGPDPIEGTAKLRSVRHMNGYEEAVIKALSPRERALAMLLYAGLLNENNLVEIASFALLGTSRSLVSLPDALDRPFGVSADRLQFLLAERGIGRCQQCDKWMYMNNSEFCKTCAGE